MASPAQPKSRDHAPKSLAGKWDLQGVLKTLYYTQDSYTGGRRGNYKNIKPHYCVFHKKS